MAKTTSKTSSRSSRASSRRSVSSTSSRPSEPAAKSPSAQPKRLPKSQFLRKAKRTIASLQTRWREFRRDKVQPHKSFRRSYREDYLRKTETPGLLSHAMTTFQELFRHWRTFLPLLLVMTGLYILLVGLMSESVYQQFQDSINTTADELANGRIGNFAKAGLLLVSTFTTAGLDTGAGESETIFMIALFLILWLVTIYLLRHFMTGGKPRLRDGLYNALAPLVSTLLVFVVLFIQAIPILLVAITYSAAVTTGFLATPFYALVYFIFAALMILISCYLLSSSIIALIAVTAPGVYPMRALFSASDLMSGRRTRFIIRILYLIVVVALIYVVVMTPIILIDLLAKGAWDWLAGWPIVPFFLLLTTCFVFIYVTAYLYKYYRYLLDYREK